MSVICFRCKSRFSEDNNMRHDCSYHRRQYSFVDDKLIHRCCNRGVGEIGCIRQIHFKEREDELAIINKGYILVHVEKILKTFKETDKEIVDNCILVNSELRDKEIIVKKDNQVFKTLLMKDLIREYELSISIDKMDDNSVFENKSIFYSDNYPDIMEYKKFKMNEFILLAPVSTISYTY